jgi:hypothetical protein
MELLVNGPAVLGAIVISVALGAWSVGRWQGGLAVTDDAAPEAMPAGGEAPVQRASLGAAGTALCQDAARAERHTALVAADSLGELHAEISAYRRAQKVLAGPEGDGLRLQPHFADARGECRFLGVMGEPTCGLAEPARTACACGTRCAHADPLPPAVTRREILRQPSASGLARV